MNSERAPEDPEAALTAVEPRPPARAGSEWQLAPHARAALIAAAEDLEQFAPELAPCRALAYRDSLPGGLIGAYVPIVGRGETFHVGVLSDVCSCDLLAGTLARVREPEERGVKAPLSALAYQLGLRFLDHVDPDHRLVFRSTIFVDGFSRHMRAGRVEAVEVVLGSIRATLVLTGADSLRASEWPSQSFLGNRRGRR
ncbi:MAG TPA: hypothetical protein VHP33_33920 [Polyangiaceae bacterium]|nr:hypothetical protein [Polyangiaceae bacterium]